MQETIKKLNGDWNRLKTKVAQRQHKFKQTQLELEQLSVLIERDYKLMSELDRVIEKSYHVLEGTEAEIEDALRVFIINMRSSYTVLIISCSFLI